MDPAGPVDNHGRAAAHRAEALFRRICPAYRHRHEIYVDRLREFLGPDTVWLDVGCGRNFLVAAHGTGVRSATGIDLIDPPDRAEAPFLRADLRRIPLPSSSADLVTLRMVVEHLRDIPEDLAEVERLLRPGGRLMIMTTNLCSPMVFFPRLLPYRVKTRVIQKLFGVGEEDVFPTHHRFNTPARLKAGFGSMRLIRLEFLEQVPMVRPVLTLVFGAWYIATMPVALRAGRSTMLAVYEKTGGSPAGAG